MWRVLILSLALLVGCGSGDVTPEPATANRYVDAVAGSDSNPGTEALPFKTITHALSLTSQGDRIHVRPGLYDEANGEVFPVVVPFGVLLLGDEASKGDGGAVPSTEIPTDRTEFGNWLFDQWAAIDAWITETRPSVFEAKA